jgi:hypothetical protein
MILYFFEDLFYKLIFGIFKLLSNQITDILYQKHDKITTKNW